MTNPVFSSAGNVAVAETFPRWHCNTNSGRSFSTNQGVIQAVYLTAGTVITNLGFQPGAVGGSISSLWMVLLDSTGKQLIHTAVQSSITLTAHTSVSWALSGGGTYTIPSSGLYYIGVMCATVTGSTYYYGYSGIPSGNLSTPYLCMTVTNGGSVGTDGSTTYTLSQGNQTSALMCAFAS